MSLDRLQFSSGNARRVQQALAILLYVAIAKDGIAGYQQIGSCLYDTGDGVVRYAPVDLNAKVQFVFFAQLAQMTNLVERKWKKLLAAKSRIHAHDQNMMHHRQNIQQQIDARGRIDDYGWLHAMLCNQVQRAMQMTTCLVMDADPVRARFGKIGDQCVGILDHQMAIQRQPRCFAQRAHHRRANRDVGHEMTIHHIYMDEGAAATLRRLHRIGQVREVSGKN